MEGADDLPLWEDDGEEEEEQEDEVEGQQASQIGNNAKRLGRSEQAAQFHLPQLRDL